MIYFILILLLACALEGATIWLVARWGGGRSAAAEEAGKLAAQERIARRQAEAELADMATDLRRAKAQAFVAQQAAEAQSARELRVEELRSMGGGELAAAGDRLADALVKSRTLPILALVLGLLLGLLSLPGLARADSATPFPAAFPTIETTCQVDGQARTGMLVYRPRYEALVAGAGELLQCRDQLGACQAQLLKMAGEGARAVRVPAMAPVAPEPSRWGERVAYLTAGVIVGIVGGAAGTVWGLKATGVL